MTIRNTFFRFYWRAAALIAPRLKYSQQIYEDVLREHSNGRERWLDLGCGHSVLPSWRLDQEQELLQSSTLVVGVDYDLEALRKHRTIRHRIRSDISSLPFRNSAFDLVTANMVFEHLKEPRTQFAEVYRILKPGGILLFHTPNIFGYTTIVARLVPERAKHKLISLLEARNAEDVYPTLYRINSVGTIEKTAEAVGFKVAVLRLIVSSAQLVMIPPLAVLELVLIRILMTRWCRPLRTNIITILQKPIEETRA